MEPIQGNVSIDAQNIMPIIKKWLYSDKDIFIREVVSNGCDAITKLRMVDSAAAQGCSIHVEVDKAARELRFIDDGVGMTEDEVKTNINQVAFSGAKSFMEEYAKNEDKENSGIIGHFGLGFYSVFMIADKVTIDTLSFREGATPVRWESEDGMAFTMTEGTRTARGTVYCLTVVGQIEGHSLLPNTVKTTKYEHVLPLLAALDALQAALGGLEFTHNNLKEANLRWHRGRFVPIRYYDARIGAAEPGTADREAFDVLRHRIAEAPVPRQTANDVTVPYNPLRSLTGHRWTSHVFEGLVCVEDDNGFGFVDTDNNPVIPAQFVWAGDFREGRAEVQTQTGMGLIDRRGCYVIPPEYEIVDYDPAASVVHVRNNGHWALFDYLGRRLTEFRTEVPEPCGPEICR